jgi:phosphatidylglycerol:prolipoprotein diacylglycerol transferase
VIDPVAVNIGPVPLRWYALAYIGGFIFGWLGLRALAANDALWRRGQPRPSRESLDDLLVFVAFGVVIGGRLGHVLIYDPAFYFAHPLEIFQTWKGGMAFHGGLVGAIIGMASRPSQRRAAAYRSDVCATVRRSDFLRPPRQFHQARDVRRETDVLGDGVSRRGRRPRHPSQL